MLLLLSLLASIRYCWRLGFGALLSKLASLASRLCHCFFVVGSGLPSCVCVNWLLCLVVGGGVLSLSLLAALQRYLKRLVYIRVIMHATTIDLQHQAQNGCAAL